MREIIRVLVFTLPLGCATAYGVIAFTPLHHHPQPVPGMIALGAVLLSFVIPALIFGKKGISNIMDELNEDQGIT